MRITCERLIDETKPSLSGQLLSMLLQQVASFMSSVA